MIGKGAERRLLFTESKTFLSKMCISTQIAVCQTLISRHIVVYVHILYTPYYILNVYIYIPLSICLFICSHDMRTYAAQDAPITRSSTSASETASVFGGVGAAARKRPGSKPAARTYRSTQLSQRMQVVENVVPWTCLFATCIHMSHISSYIHTPKRTSF